MNEKDAQKTVVQSTDYPAMIEELLRQNTELKRELDLSQKESEWVGVRNTFGGICFVSVLGGKKDGSDDIQIPGKQARPIPSLTWKTMLQSSNLSITSGQLVRDDTILGEFEQKKSAQKFNEGRFPNMVLDEDIEGWLSLTLSKYKKRVSLITSVPVVSRVIAFTKTAKPKPHDKLEFLHKHFMTIANPLPPHFNEVTDYQEAVDIGNMLNINFGKTLRENRGDVDVVKRIITRELDDRRSNITKI